MQKANVNDDWKSLKEIGMDFPLFYISLHVDVYEAVWFVGYVFSSTSGLFTKMLLIARFGNLYKIWWL